MKNTFKCHNINRDASCSSHSRPRTNEVITLASSSRERDSTFHPSVKKPIKEHRPTFCAENVKIAAIFLPRTVSNHGTNVWDGQQKVDFPCQFQQQMKIPQDAKHRYDKSHRQGRRRERLEPPDVSRCLEKIQTSNPAFPAQTAFSSLKEKSRALCSGNSLKKKTNTTLSLRLFFSCAWP